MLGLERLYAAGCALGGERVGAALFAEEFDAGGAEFVAGVRVREVEFDAVAVGGVDEETDVVRAGVARDQRDERIEAVAVVVFVCRFVEEESEDARR